MNAVEREGPQTPVRLMPEDFEVHRSELLTQDRDRRDGRPLVVDGPARLVPGGEEGGARAAQPDQRAVPPRPALHPRLLRLRAGAAGLGAAVCALGRVGARHEHAPRADAGAADAREARRRHAPDHHDLGRGADGAPRARPLAVLLPAEPGDDPRDPQGGAALHPGEDHDQHLHAGPQLLPQRVREPAGEDQRRSRLLHDAGTSSASTFSSTMCSTSASASATARSVTRLLAELELSADAEALPARRSPRRSRSPRHAWSQSCMPTAT